jgi:DNA-binding response OmpR family regulator
MAEYLSKEEIKQWRSSLEKITLEEFAARLGKKIESGKPTKDLVDIVLQGKPVMSADWKQSNAERLNTIAQRAMEREKEISVTPFKKYLPEQKPANSQITFKKALTEREQRVFDHLLANSGKIVYAKELAELLDLPRDYVYKYIKNLRSKIEGENLQNADKSGFVLNV